MKVATTKQRVIADGAIDRSAGRGTLMASCGDLRDLHGWLELNTALEAMLETGCCHAPATSSINRPAGGPAPTLAPSAHKLPTANRSETGVIR
jgi:hypothetical protein